jgi:hypothetical protein
MIFSPVRREAEKRRIRRVCTDRERPAARSVQVGDNKKTPLDTWADGVSVAAEMLAIVAKARDHQHSEIPTRTKQREET